MRELARQHTEMAINTLAEICEKGTKVARASRRHALSLAVGGDDQKAHDALIDATDEALRVEVRRRSELERTRPPERH